MASFSPSPNQKFCSKIPPPMAPRDSWGQTSTKSQQSSSIDGLLNADSSSKQAPVLKPVFPTKTTQSSSTSSKELPRLRRYIGKVKYANDNFAGPDLVRYIGNPLDIDNNYLKQLERIRLTGYGPNAVAGAAQTSLSPPKDMEIEDFKCVGAASFTNKNNDTIITIEVDLGDNLVNIDDDLSKKLERIRLTRYSPDDVAGVPQTSSSHPKVMQIEDLRCVGVASSTNENNETFGDNLRGTLTKKLEDKFADPDLMRYSNYGVAQAPQTSSSYPKDMKIKDFKCFGAASSTRENNYTIEDNLGDSLTNKLEDKFTDPNLMRYIGNNKVNIDDEFSKKLESIRLTRYSNNGVAEARQTSSLHPKDMKIEELKCVRAASCSYNYNNDTFEINLGYDLVRQLENIFADTAASSSYDNNDTFEVNLGNDLVKQLEDKFADPDLQYPKGFQPVVQMPVAFARKFYKICVKSMYEQQDIHQDEKLPETYKKGKMQ
ncbi:unnamed protein product [Ceutorhynchus assimilis]|uniref:Uncharacterized protein n=1 Tax=Ceutorhynchus assimilis TaxID=467358 RepID=A0A9P0DGI6_9CUCU|nr:unnamed protein product [Ceutorhynchus assimilis]